MRREKLRTLVREYSERNRHNDCSGVYSVTNSHGFMPSTDYFSKEVFSKDLSTYKVVKRGMIAYNPSRINVGSVAVQRERETVIVSPLYVVFSVDESKILPEFLTYFLHSDEGLQQIAANTSGSVRDSLKFSALQNIEINLYSIEEQQEIIAILNKFDKLLHDEREALQKINDLVKSQFIEMFGDVVYNNKRWVVFPMSTVAPIKAFKGEVEAVDGKVWLLNLDMIEAHTGDVQEEVLVGIDDIGASTVAFNRDNILYSKLRPYLNKVVYPKKTGYATSELVPLRPDINLLNKVFFTALLRSDAFVHFIREQVAGAKMPRVSMDIFKKFDVICPPIELQNQFAHFVEQTDKSKFRIKQSLEKLETCYNAMLQKYFG